jgi:hypothetical protein
MVVKSALVNRLTPLAAETQGRGIRTAIEVDRLRSHVWHLNQHDLAGECLAPTDQMDIA